MFRKLKAGLGGKGKAKFRLDVAVERVEGLPAGVSAARLQWARGAKVAVTKLVPANAGGHVTHFAFGLSRLDDQHFAMCEMLVRADAACHMSIQPPCFAAGAVEWKEELSQIATLVRSGSGFEPKAYEFKLQVGALGLSGVACGSCPGSIT